MSEGRVDLLHVCKMISDHPQVPGPAKKAYHNVQGDESLRFGDG